MARAPVVLVADIRGDMGGGQSDPFDLSPLYRDWKKQDEEKYPDLYARLGSEIPEEMGIAPAVYRTEDILSTDTISRRAWETSDSPIPTVVNDFEAWRRQRFLKNISGAMQAMAPDYSPLVQFREEFGVMNTPEELQESGYYDPDLLAELNAKLSLYGGPSTSFGRDEQRKRFEDKKRKEEEKAKRLAEERAKGGGFTLSELHEIGSDTYTPPPSQEELDARGVTEVRNAIIQAGGDPDTYYDKGASFEESWGSLGPADRLGHNLRRETLSSYPWRVLQFFTPYNPTPNEVKNILRGDDPAVETKWIDPRRPELGVLVRGSSKGSIEDWNNWVPFKPPEILRSPHGARPLVDETITAIGQDALGIMIEGGGLYTLGRRIANRGIQKLNKLLESGDMKAIEASISPTVSQKIGTGLKDVSAIATIAGTANALGRAATLLYGKQQGIHPDLSFERIVEDTKFAMIMGASGALGGELLFRSLSKLYEGATGQLIPEHELQRIRLRAMEWREKFGKDAKPTSDRDLSESIEVMGEEGAALAKRLQENRTWTNMTTDDLLGAMEASLMQTIPHWSPVRAEAEMNLDRTSRHLREFYEELKMDIGDEGRAKLPTYKELTERIQEIRDAGIKADIAAEEASVVSTREAMDAGMDTPSRQELAEQQEILQAQERMSRLFPDMKSEIVLMKQRDVKEAQNQLDAVLRQNHYQTLTTDNLKGNLQAYVKGPLKKMLDAGDTPDSMFRLLDNVQASEELRSMIPMFRDSEGELRSMIRELMGGLNRSDETGRMLARYPFTFPQVQQARDAVRTVFGNHPNRQVREAAEEVLAGFDNALEDLLDQGYKTATDSSALPPNLDRRRDTFGSDFIRARDNLYAVQKEVDGKLLYQLADADDPEQIADIVLRTSPNKIEPLITRLREDAEGLEKISAIQEMFQAKMVRMVKDQDPKKQSRNLKNFLKKYDLQIEALFGKEAGLDKFQSLGRLQEQMATEIRVGKDSIDRLYKLLGTDVEFPSLVSGLLESSVGTKRGFEESAQRQKFEALSKLADQYPDIRAALQGSYSTWLRRTLEGSTFDTMGDRAMRGAFDQEALQRFVIDPYSVGPTGTNELARDLGLILGKEEGLRQAAGLRRLFTELKPLNDREWMRTVDQLNQGQAVPAIDAVKASIQGGQRLLQSPLTKLGRQTSALRRSLNTDRFLLEIITDIDKLEAFLKYRNRKLTAGGVAQLLGSIAVVRAEDPGAGIETTPEDAFRESLRQAPDKLMKDALPKGPQAKDRIFDLLQGAP